jgi:hypothetical protein
MGKRSTFERVERDFYKTPWEPVVDLSPHLDDVQAYIEPCCGDGTLIKHLAALGHTCVYACDLAPQEPWQDPHGSAMQGDALDIKSTWDATHFITNPPWPSPRSRGEPTLGIIRHLSSLLPTWLLLSADFMHNVYAAEVLAYCTKIVSVGRVKWIEGSENTGKDNAAWYKFDRRIKPAVTWFHGRGNGVPVYSPDIEELVG